MSFSHIFAVLTLVFFLAAGVLVRVRLARSIDAQIDAQIEDRLEVSRTILNELQNSHRRDQRRRRLR